MHYVLIICDSCDGDINKGRQSIVKSLTAQGSCHSGVVTELGLETFLSTYGEVIRYDRLA